MYDVEAQIFEKRRRELMDRIGSNGVAVLFGEPERTRSNDTEFPYRPSSDILYLSGFREPGCVLVLAPGPGRRVHPVRATTRPRGRDVDWAPLWDRRAVSEFGANAAYDIAEIDKELPKFLAHRDTAFWPIGQDHDFDRRMIQYYTGLRFVRRRAPEAPARFGDIRDLVHEMRLFKAPEELDLMRKAAQVTSDAHVAAMRATKPGVREFELQAVIESYFRRHGAEFPAYSSIVGTGDNATILHYTENRSALESGELVLIDAGCEYHFYAADITRTWPVSGKFEGAARDAYQGVLEAQEAAINDVRAGIRYNELQERTARRLSEVMIALGALTGSVDEAVESETYRKYYPHNVSHWLGIDVHDVGAYFDDTSQWRKLEPGMVLTIEPGLYFPAHDESLPAGLRGVGIRIEDDILVTSGDPENLTHACPKSIEAIESVINAGL
ncbi:MAG: aminopeptidase P N-terminal domain-containing protein [bacterium]